MLVILVSVMSIVWMASEVILGLFSRTRRDSAVVRDRGSLVLLWTAIVAGLAVGNVIRFRGLGSMGAPQAPLLCAALVAIVCGLALRWTAILTLGRLFTTTVAVSPGQRIVRTGVYRHVRHPAYTGLLLALLGFGLALQNWLSLLAVVIPVAAALWYRMRVEEKVLVDILGREYVTYCGVTKRLIPGVY